MGITKICAHCGKEFVARSNQQMYCPGPHFRPCPVCGVPVQMIDNDFSRPCKCCSPECTHKLRRSKFKAKKCIFCGKEFTPKSGVQIACEDIHYQDCEICGKPFKIDIKLKNDNVTTCSPECAKEKTRRFYQAKYGVDHPMQNQDVQKHFHDAMKAKYGVEHALQIPGKIQQQQHSVIKTNMERYGVPYACYTPGCINSRNNLISHVNRDFGKQLANANVSYSFERRLDNRSYDICIEDQKTLIEIDPTFTHSSVYTGLYDPVAIDYHLKKSQLATEHGYRCVHVFDWDDWGKIVNMFVDKRSVYARKCKLYRINKAVGDKFLNDYHIQGACRGQLLYLGLVYDDELIQLMTFGKPRYDKKYDVELLRFVTRPDVRVIGGASKLFKFATQDYGLHNIISYCDVAKFTGDVYEKIGMKLERVTPPQEIWSKEEKYITANLLRSRGYDQLFHTSYGKGTSNEDLMLQNEWYPIYDCGQRVYVFE